MSFGKVAQSDSRPERPSKKHKLRCQRRTQYRPATPRAHPSYREDSGRLQPRFRHTLHRDH
eukprot:4010038-Prymnesium_polylepis.1